MGRAKRKAGAPRRRSKRAEHPGASLRIQLIQKRGLSVTEAADMAQVSRVTLSRVLHEHAALSPLMAAKLEAVFRIEAQPLLEAQAAFDLERERKTLHAAG